MAAHYAQSLKGATSLDERLVRLVELRSAEGYMAEYARREDGTYVIAENHCPICATAAGCQGFCRSELALFAASPRAERGWSAPSICSRVRGDARMS